MSDIKNALIDLRQISLTLEGRLILDHVSFCLNQGQILTVIGPNGAGKTSLLKIVLGILSPSSGSVLRRKGLVLGYVPQKINFSKTLPLSVERFLCLSQTYTRFDLINILTQTQTQHLIDQDVFSLSGGELQRILLARALLQTPDLLILDEPTQGLDPRAEEAFYTLLYALNKEKGYTILMVSHDLHVVMARTDQVVCLNKHICCFGTPQDIVGLPEYLSLYGHQHTHTHLSDRTIKHDLV